jgi:hypothetical protein
VTSRYVQIAAHQDLSLSAVIRGERSLSSTMRHFLDSSTAKLLQHTPAPPVAAQRAVSKVSALAGINARKQLVEQQKQQPPAPELEPAAPAGSPPHRDARWQRRRESEAVTEVNLCLLLKRVHPVHCLSHDAIMLLMSLLREMQSVLLLRAQSALERGQSSGGADVEDGAAGAGAGAAGGEGGGGAELSSSMRRRLTVGFAPGEFGELVHQAAERHLSIFLAAKEQERVDREGVAEGGGEFGAPGNSPGRGTPSPAPGGGPETSPAGVAGAGGGGGGAGQNRRPRPQMRKAPGRGGSSTPTSFRLTVQVQRGRPEVFVTGVFKVNADKPLESLFEKVCQQFALDPRKTVFVFRGAEVSAADSPALAGILPQARMLPVAGPHTPRREPPAATAAAAAVDSHVVAGAAGGGGGCGGGDLAEAASSPGVVAAEAAAAAAAAAAADDDATAAAAAAAAAAGQGAVPASPRRAIRATVIAGQGARVVFGERVVFAVGAAWWKNSRRNEARRGLLSSDRGNDKAVNKYRKAQSKVRE